LKKCFTLAINHKILEFYLRKTNESQIVGVDIEVNCALNSI